MKTILILIRLKEHHKALLEQSFPDARFLYAAPKHVTDEQLQSADAILGNPVPERLQGLSRLKLLQLHSAGSDPYDKEGILPPGCTLYNASGVYGLAVSEHMLAMTLALTKKLHLYRDNQRESRWFDEGEVMAIEGLRILVIGAGDIGARYARLCNALGAYTIGLRRTVTKLQEGLNELYPMEKLDSLLPEVDLVAMALPATNETNGLMDARRFALMRQGALFVNGGRGTTVDQDALLDALQRGHLGGAATDVTDPEPLPPEHPLWQQKNLILTPHIAGLFHVPKTLDLLIARCIQTLQKHWDSL